MDNHEKTYKFKITIFSSMLLVLATISISLSLYINTSNQTFSNYVDVAGQQRMLSQRIALAASLISRSDNEMEYNQYIQDTRSAIQKLDQNQYYLDQIVLNHPKLKKNYEQFFTQNNENGVSRHNTIDAYLNLTKKYLKLAKQTTYQNTDFTQLQQNQKRVAHIALNDILPIFQGNIEVFNAYIASETRKNIYIKTISTLIFVIIIILSFLWIFTPLKNRFIETALLSEQQKETLALEKERYALATNGTSIGIWDLDIKTNLFYWNPLLNQILGLNDNRTQYHTDFFQDIIHPNDKDAFNNDIIACIKKHERLDHTCRVMHADGHYIWCRISGRSSTQANGKTLRLIGSLEDITDKKLAEIQRDIFIEGIEQSGIAMALINPHDTNKNFTYVTQSLCDMLGHDGEKLLKTNLNAFTGPNTNMGDLDAIDSAINEGRSLSVKILNYKQDGQSFWNLLSISPIHDKYNEHEITHFAVTFEDLTQSIEKERLEINRQRNESLGALASSVAHEINNLLMPMTMAKDILEPELKEDHDPFAIEQLDMMVEYANQARDIVAGILLFARKETEDLEPTSINEILHETIAFIRNLLRLETKIEFSMHDDEIKNIVCMVNKTEFRQIIANLTKNAEDAFNNKEGHIDISVHKTIINNADKKQHNTTANDFVAISVRDNGTGIPEEIIKDIFDPMFTTKAIGEGTGLGLSVVHGILQSWGGFITVESIPDIGTTFIVHIPIVQDDENYSHLIDLIEMDDV